MLYKTNYPVAIRLDRIEKGQEIELTEEEAFNLGDAVSLVTGPAPEPVAAPEKAVADMSLSELKAKAAELGLSASGSKADLVDRITLAVSASEDAN